MLIASSAQAIKNPYQGSINQAALETGVDAKLIKAMIVIESTNNPNAISKCGAVGLMQLTRSTAKKYGVKNRRNPHQNIRGGSKYLKHLLQVFKGNNTMAIAAFNAGEFAVKKYKGIPPYRETRNHVVRVLAEMRR